MNSLKIHNLIESFSSESLIDFFREKTSSFTPKRDQISSDNPDFINGQLVGVFTTDNENFGRDNVAVFSFKTGRPLNERSGKKGQYEVAKKILKNNPGYTAGIFVFYDDKGDFRFSLVYDIITDTAKRQWSNFRRFTYFVSKEQTNKTFINRLSIADFSKLERDDEEIKSKPDKVYIKEAFSVEKVTDEFFDAYRYALNEVIIESLSDYEVDYRIKHSFAQQLLSRILFIYFLQRKDWLKWKDYKQDKNYLRNLWLNYKTTVQNKNTFYSIWLSSLFYGAFNKKPNLISPELPDEIKESFALMPFLNGGLFSKNELDEHNFQIPDHVFEWLFEPDELGNNKFKGFLEIFNFTIDEASPDDAEVAVDPEMLGNVYESLINSDERGEAGIFYTPRVEIDFMSRLSLVNYLSAKTQINKNDLLDIIFSPSIIESYNHVQNLIEIRKNLSKAKIVDPACGSASFLVGMMNILVELHTALTRKIEGREENIFALKHRIILENLFGVDVKDWAVMVGELRLWLSLIIETDEKYMDIYTKPLLPNLSFKIRQGDSLVEDVAGVFINLRGDTLKALSAQIQQKLNALIDKKAEFFSGKRSADLREQKEIEDMEKDIFTSILQEKINSTANKIIAKTTTIKELSGIKTLFGEKDTKSKNLEKQIAAEIEQLKVDFEKYQKALSEIDKKQKKDYFLWELDFAEVFALNGGFDIVIGNPPYVRQELIAPPLENEADYSPDEWKNIKKQYKEKLIKATQNVWNDVKKIDRKSDLYVYFYFQGLSLLNSNGIFCFINSNSWLDVGYGAGLQEFLLKQMKPLYIIDNIAKRSFKHADVNTVIVIIQKPETKPDGFNLKFVAFKKPFEEAITPEVLKELEVADKPIFDHPVYRIYPKTKKELLEEGVEYPDDYDLELNLSAEQLPYIGNKWGGKYLRAPEIYFKILEKGKDKLVRLGDIAEVRRGFTTGVNEFFYLKPVDITVKEVVEIAEKNPHALIRVKNGAGWEGEIEAEFLKPVIKSPRELKTIMVRIEDLNYLVFMCHKNKEDLKDKKALEYIEWGESKEYNLRPTCRSRNLWWDLGEREIGDLSYSYIIGEIHKIPINKKYLLDCNLFDIILYESQILNNVGYFLNTAIFRLFLELAGREMTGALTVLKVQVFELEKQPILIPHLIFLKDNSFHLFSRREIKSIIEELGFDPNLPIREQEPNPLPDRKELDDIVFDALGLTEEERKEVYWAVAELVKARLDKARSV
ncbi:MAG: Eco57I restriction-modification methylase domain-containing protein [Paludibacteraceae bacterium]|nr:Eco57I restriction-modification methylase domain-containing protein [Paludibacteraceae bacterium]